MRSTLLNISSKIDHLSLEILTNIKKAADALNIDFFITGATVRDMILHYAHNIPIYRSTNDIDFAVRLKSWEDYNSLIDEIEKIGFYKDARIIHRFRYKGMIIDFIPFGDITTEDEIIIWPDNDKKEMSVIGFEDAYKNTEDILVQRNPDITIKAVSVACLAMLKIFAWNGRTADIRLKDAKDLYLIIIHYLEAGNLERLFNEHPDLAEGDVDYELNSARLLGRDIARAISKNALIELLNIFKEENIKNLSTEMSYSELIIAGENDKEDKCYQILKHLIMGLKDYFPDVI